MESEQGLLGQGKKIVAYYPSGKAVEGSGKLYFAKMPDTDASCPVIVPDEKHVLVLDPRAIVTIDGAIRYHPRAFRAHVAPWVRQWLDEHPEWAKVGSLEGEAPGARPNGTRVRKRVFEPGDAHPVGATGTVAGSLLGPAGRYFYFVKWDDNPGVPVGVQAHKIEPA